MPARLPDLPSNASDDMKRWWASVKRALDADLSRLDRIAALPTHQQAALPSAALPQRWIAVTTGTGTAARTIPAWNDGTSWRAYTGTNTSTL